MKKVSVSPARSKSSPSNSVTSTPSRPLKAFTPVSVPKPEIIPTIPTFESFAKKALDRSPKRNIDQSPKFLPKPKTVDKLSPKLATAFQIPTPSKQLNQNTPFSEFSQVSTPIKPSAPTTAHSAFTNLVATAAAPENMFRNSEKPISLPAKSADAISLPQETVKQRLPLSKKDVIATK